MNLRSRIGMDGKHATWSHSLFHHVIDDDAANKQSRYVAALRQRHPKRSIADEWEIGHQRKILRVETESFAFDCRQIFRDDVCFIRPDEIHRMLPHFGVDSTIIDERLIAETVQLFWLRFGDPFGGVIWWHFRWWSAPKVSRIRSWSSENDNCHELWCRHFAQEHNEHCAKLPFAEIAQCLCHGVDANDGRHCGRNWDQTSEHIH